MSGVEPAHSVDSAVELSWIGDHVAVVAMHDRAARNCSSPALIAGVEHAFAQVAARPDARVVVVHGYDNYFCCGGTLDELLLISSQKVEFTHYDFYDICLRSPIPVIAAMQGHALGAGLGFGCYADILVLAEESIYCANFMRYGFTPGVGSTFIIPHKFGETLGWEMMMSARNFYGRELRERGAPVRVVARQKVIETAIALAQEMAAIPLIALRELKSAYVQRIRPGLDAAIQQELSMHQRIFARPEAQERIRALYANT